MNSEPECTGPFADGKSCPKCNAEKFAEAARPSVPAQGQAVKCNCSVAWPTGSCPVHFPSLAASRSETQPPHIGKCQHKLTEVILRAGKNPSASEHDEIDEAFDNLTRAIEAGAPAAGSAERWIPVSEKLPDFPESNRWQDGTHNYNSTDAVLAWDGSEIVKAVMYSDHGKPTIWSEQSEGATVKSVTHWQALPTPPK